MDVSSAGSTSQGTTSTSTTTDPSTTLVESTGVEAECGNGVMEAGEDCDDGNMADADGCNADCVESGALRWSVTHVTPPSSMSLYRDVVVVDGEPVVVGFISSQAEDSNALMLRYDAQGDVVWSQTVDGEGRDDRLDGVAYDGQLLVAAGRSVVEDPVAGPQGLVWLLTALPGGSVPAEFTGPRGRGLAIAPTANGVLIAGEQDPGGIPWAGGFTTDGTEIFSATAGDGEGGSMSDAVVDARGRMFATGYRETAQGQDFIVEEVSGSDLVSLARLAGPFGSAQGQALTVTASGDLWAGGYVRAGTDNGHRNWLARRYRPTGEVVSEDEWTQPGSMLSDELEAITVDPAGDVIAGGFTNVGGNSMMMVRRYSASGTIRWTQTYDYGDGKDVIRGITTDDEGAIYIAGEVTESTGQALGWLARLHP